jgi:glycosidase
MKNVLTHHFLERFSNMDRRFCTVLAFCFLFAQVIVSQTINVKFRYEPQAVYVRVNFPGEFNGWGPNSSGTILAGAPSQADSLEAATGMWVKTFPMTFGTHQYKIYQQLSSTSTNWNWISDPLNRVVVTSDENSQFVVDSLVLFQICAYPYAIEAGVSGNAFVVKTGLPKLSAGIFHPAGGPAVTISAILDGTPIANAGSYYDTSSGIYTYAPSGAIADGNHVFRINASAGGQSKTDSMQFTVRARPVQILTPSFVTHKTVYVTAGIILKPDDSGPDSSISSVSLFDNGIMKSVAAANGAFADSTLLSEGNNLIRVATPNGADSIVVTRLVNHSPNAIATAQDAGSSVTLSAASTTDPDSQTVTNFKWLDDPVYSLGLSGKTGVTTTVAKPANPGEYYFGLVAIDPGGNVDTTRSYFIIKADGSVQNPVIQNNPQWAKQARVYFLFPKAFTQAGTISAAAARLQYVKDMGFNVIWVMPVMKNAYPINQQSGPGYNIVDFYNVAPEYGTNQDFKNFVTQAHTLGLKVILDVTPNHSSWIHPWSADAHANKLNSPYWNWYEHNNQPDNQTNGLGSSLDGGGFNYYSGFSSQLLNLNWSDVDMRSEMINVYKYWVQQFGLDGFRFDVYWGPHRRYGEQFMGEPVRAALKHIKPDILLLGEDDGTGSGTQYIYADQNGGLDASYDFNLYFNGIENFGFMSTSIDNLNNDINNGGYFPGPDALYMRFMESQDEDRIAYLYSSVDSTTTFMRTMPMATTIFTVPGFPMIWNGQEVGWGYGISGSKEDRDRSTIGWDYAGKNLLTPHYQRLAWIRGAFPAFATQKYLRLSTGNGLVYGIARPYNGGNSVALMNFGGSPASAAITLSAGNAALAPGIKDGTYYLNDVYNDTSSTVTVSFGVTNFSTTLPAYGSAVYVLSDSVIKLVVPTLTSVKTQPGINSLPREFVLSQNYPNPFNPSTSIEFALPNQQFVTLKIFDVLGRVVATLVDEKKEAGRYSVQWNAFGLSSGVYFCMMRAGTFAGTNKLLLVR